MYRDSITKLLSTPEVIKGKNVREAFNDTVLPELNKIDVVVGNEQRRLRRSAAIDLFAGAGLVGIGLFAGLLPEIGKTVAQLGGFGFGLDVVRRGFELAGEPTAARESPFYFLWKAKKMARSAKREM